MRSRRGFTLIELLVVIAIIAILIGILLPALAQARAAGRRATCAGSLRSVAQAVAVYTGTHDIFPLAYAYGADETGTDWSMEQQSGSHPRPANGYVHWSYSLFDLGVNEESFACAAVLHGGAPRTNPGANPRDWEPEQVNALGASAPAALPQDRQAARMAYTGNAAIFARNKLITSTARKNRFVRASEVDASPSGAARTILATEFFDNGYAWRSLATSSNGKIKSHRPLTPFLGLSSGNRVYLEPDVGEEPRFVYPPRRNILEDRDADEHVIVNADSRLNAVGRHHPGGKANFVFVDGHVDAHTVRESVQQRLWGDRFFSISGNSAVDVDANAF